MQVTVQGLGQTLSFQSGAVENHMLLEFPDGRVVQVGIDADTAAYVTSTFVGSGGAAAQRAVAEASSQPAHTRHRAPVPSAGPTAVAGDFSPVAVDGEEDVFGGDYGGNGTAAEDEWQDSTSEPSPAPQVAALSTRRAALRVSADAKGNPVIQGGNVVDQTELVGGLGASDEEDGVGSV